MRKILTSVAMLMSFQSPAADLQTLTDAVKNSESAYLSTLESLVRIDSDTGNMEGSQKIADFIQMRLAPLGGKIEFVKSDKPGGVHVIARFAGEGRKRVLLYGHSDTVLSSKAGHGYKYDPATKIAYGPGAADSKGSVAMLLESIRLMSELNERPYKELILYIDAEEEGGSKTEDELVEKLAKEVDVALIADTGRPDFGIVTKRKASGNFTIRIKGISGHGGNAPHAGANALTEAGYLIVELDKLNSRFPDNPLEYTAAALAAKGIKDRGQFIPDNVLNIAVISTPNNKTNVIPDQVELRVNLRTYEQKEFERIQKAIIDLAKKPRRQGVTITVEGAQGMPPLELAGDSLKLVNAYKKVAKATVQKEVSEWMAGGVTPANSTARFVPTIDCIGVDSDPMLEHSVKEELQVGAYVPRTIALIEFLKEIDKVQFK